MPFDTNMLNYTYSSFNSQVFLENLRENFIFITIVLIITAVLLKIGKNITESVIKKSIKTDSTIDKNAKKRRVDTLVRIVTALFYAVLIVISLTVILNKLGVNTSAIIAGAGIAGIAIGFGAQSLIKDLVAGGFIILENQYRVGDVVCLDDTCGLVEDISLRMTRLRNLDGTVHHVPNGSFETSSNLTKSYAGINMDIGISYDSDIEKVEKVINKLGSDLAKEKEFEESIIEPPKFLRVDNFADSAVIIKITGKTVPLQQWAVSGELRKRILITFRKEGIVIPFPQRDLNMRSK